MIVPSTAKVVDVMEKAIVDNGNDYTFTATYKTYSWRHGFFLDVLNDTAGTDTTVIPYYYWALYLDGEYTQEGMSDTKIACVSIVSWRYVKSTSN